MNFTVFVLEYHCLIFSFHLYFGQQIVVAFFFSFLMSLAWLNWLGWKVLCKFYFDFLSLVPWFSFVTCEVLSFDNMILGSKDHISLLYLLSWGPFIPQKVFGTVFSHHNYAYLVTTHIVPFLLLHYFFNMCDIG